MGNLFIDLYTLQRYLVLVTEPPRRDRAQYQFLSTSYGRRAQPAPPLPFGAKRRIVLSSFEIVQGRVGHVERVRNGVDARQLQTVRSPKDEIPAAGRGSPGNLSM